MIAKLHYITQQTETLDHHELAEIACAAGVQWVQLRVKNASYNEWLNRAVKTEAVCRKHHARFIINDNVTLAKAVKADGVHLGKEDMDPREARNMLGTSSIIGGTANTFEDIERLVRAGVDYIGLGPFRFTATKEKLSPVLGLEGYEAITSKCREAGIRVPLIAIGGIQTQDVRPLLGSGVYGIAVSSAISHSGHRTETIKKFLSKTQEKKHH